MIAYPFDSMALVMNQRPTLSFINSYRVCRQKGFYNGFTARCSYIGIQLALSWIIFDTLKTALDHDVALVQSFSNKFSI